LPQSSEILSVFVVGGNSVAHDYGGSQDGRFSTAYGEDGQGSRLSAIGVRRRFN